jgi:hypothetical protein
MKTLCALILLSCAPSILVADETAKKLTVSVPGGATLEAVAPAGWSLTKIQVDPTARPTLLLDAPHHDATLQITFFIDTVGELATKENVASRVASRAKWQYLIGSLEKKITLETLDVPGAICVYAQFTDAGIEGKKEKLGPFKVVATGVIKFGNTIGTITLLGNSFDDKAFQIGKVFLKTGLTVHK